MNVYVMDADYENYRACVTDGRDSIDSCSQMPIGKPLAKDWYPLQYKYANQIPEEDCNPNIQMGDFIGVEFTDIGLPFTTFAKVGSLFTAHGELLPLNLEGDTNRVFWFHCTNVIDALDLSQSSLRQLADGKVIGIEHHAFHADKIGRNEIFQVSTTKSRVFCTEPFKTKIESLGLTGLRFRLEWTNEAVAANNKVKSQV